MQVLEEELVACFRALSDEELLRKASAGTLTFVALKVAGVELHRRGLAVPEQIEQVEGLKGWSMHSPDASLISSR